MSDPDAKLDVYIQATSGLIGLAIDDVQRPGVRQFLTVAAEMASLLDLVELPGHELTLASTLVLPGMALQESA